MVETLKDSRQELNEKIDKLQMGEVVSLFHYVRGWLHQDPEFWEAVESWMKERGK